MCLVTALSLEKLYLNRLSRGFGDFVCFKKRKSMFICATNLRLSSRIFKEEKKEVRLDLTNRQQEIQFCRKFDEMNKSRPERSGGN